MTDDEKHEAAMTAARPLMTGYNGWLDDACRAYHAEMMRHERAEIRAAALREAAEIALGYWQFSITGKAMSDAILALIEKGAE